MSKRCNKCGNSKEFSSFSKNTHSDDGLQATCKECMSLYTKKHYAQNRLEILRKKREHYYKNHDRELLRHAVYRINHPEKRTQSIQKWKRNNPNKIRQYDKFVGQSRPI